MSPQAQVQWDAGDAAEHIGLWQLSSFPAPEPGADPGCAVAVDFTGPTRLGNQLWYDCASRNGK